MSHRMLAEAAERALALRGTVMLSVAGDERRWCAVCAAVDGTLEVRVGEPSRGWLRRRDARAEQWLSDHGFLHRIDAWSAPAPPGATPRWCADTLAAALEHGLGAPPGAGLAEVLVHPGVIEEVTPPPPGAPHAAHIHAALRALAARGRGSADVEGGRPAKTWAWAFFDDGKVVMSPESPKRLPDSSRDWTVPAREPELEQAAGKLAAILHDDDGRDPAAPLFVSLMDV